MSTMHAYRTCLRVCCLPLPIPQELDQLHKIFQVMGMPDEVSWPVVSELPNFKAVCGLPAPLKQSSLAGIVNGRMDAAGLDLPKCMLTLAPQQRITARMALRHPYFGDMDALLRNPPRHLGFF